MTMLGTTCSKCCRCECEPGGALPETVTVTFQGINNQFDVCTASPPLDASYLNGKSILLERRAGECMYSACYRGFSLHVMFRSYFHFEDNGNRPRPAASVTISAHGGETCRLAFTLNASTALNCSQFQFTATADSGATATVTPGDSENVFSCRDVFNASSVLVSVEAQDYLQKLHQNTPPGQCVDNRSSTTIGFPGSKYAGQFELQLHDAVVTLPALDFEIVRKRFRYYYSDPQLCGGPYLELVATRETPAPASATYTNRLSLRNPTMLFWSECGENNHKSLSELVCAETGGTGFFEFGPGDDYWSGQATCSCDAAYIADNTLLQQWFGPGLISQTAPSINIKMSLKGVGS